jgi:hypothetical protein
VGEIHDQCSPKTQGRERGALLDVALAIHHASIHHSQSQGTGGGISFARKAIIESPNLIPAYRALVVNSALAGDVDEAKLALQALQRLVPDLSLKSIDGVMPYVRDGDRNRYLEGFRLAGLR